MSSNTIIPKKTVFPVDFNPLENLNFSPDTEAVLKISSLAEIIHDKFPCGQDEVHPGHDLQQPSFWIPGKSDPYKQESPKKEANDSGSENIDPDNSKKKRTNSAEKRAKELKNKQIDKAVEKASKFIGYSSPQNSRKKRGFSTARSSSPRKTTLLDDLGIRWFQAAFRVSREIDNMQSRKRFPATCALHKMICRYKYFGNNDLFGIQENQYIFPKNHKKKIKEKYKLKFINTLVDFEYFSKYRVFRTDVLSGVFRFQNIKIGEGALRVICKKRGDEPHFKHYYYKHGELNNKIYKPHHVEVCTGYRSFGASCETSSIKEVSDIERIPISVGVSEHYGNWIFQVIAEGQGSQAQYSAERATRVLMSGIKRKLLDCSLMWAKDVADMLQQALVSVVGTKDNWPQTVDRPRALSANIIFPMVHPQGSIHKGILRASFGDTWCFFTNLKEKKIFHFNKSVKSKLDAKIILNFGLLPDQGYLVTSTSSLRKCFSYLELPLPEKTSENNNNTAHDKISLSTVLERCENTPQGLSKELREFFIRSDPKAHMGLVISAINPRFSSNN